MKFRFLALALLGVAALAGNQTQAAMPPQAYESLMQRSPEAFDLEIIRVQKRVVGKHVEDKALVDGKDNVATDTEISAQARVLRTHRSGDNRVRAGDVIDIVYINTTWSLRPLPGPGQPRVLSVGDKLTVYLERREGSFRPAAYGASFQEIGSPVR